MKRYFITAALIACLTVGLVGCGEDTRFKNRRHHDDCTDSHRDDHRQDQKAYKPIIYLYPETETDVSVHLDYAGTLTCTYPDYHDGWQVHAKPDGTLTDPETGRTYYGLFWEGIEPGSYDMSSGFVVPGNETVAFLEDALAKLGLTETEAQEFIIFWLPQMQDNPYNLIRFQDTAYTKRAKLDIEPKPDTVIRVFMTWRALDAPIDIPAQTLSAPQRRGFTVVEWGGSECPVK
ncbi:MAG: hypothetical protein Q4P30_05325 [Eubacteriales bacterium]|nr:hypothetical protein [Eubacteriales bacterium]